MAISSEEIQRLVPILREASPQKRAQFVRDLRMENAVTILRQFSEEEQKELLDLLPPAMTRELHEVLTEKVEMPSELIDEILKENCVLFL